MQKNLLISVLYTVVTGVFLGILYPLLMTGLAQALFYNKANGQLIVKNGVVIGSRLIGQNFSGPTYFHSRPSAAGTNGYDATASGGSNYGPANKKYIDRIEADVAMWQTENPGVPVPVDLVTTSGSGLDPDITPAAAYFQVPNVARTRGIPEDQLKELVAKHTIQRQLGLLGEPRVNVLELNLALDKILGKNYASK
ncbi:MAG TPA: potassium-transporting ATPase subunit KdpC [Edaphobacter sp.]|nr:potassium-transporting ATPase subunit KdpC [Edaphobacter sp.]